MAVRQIVARWWAALFVCEYLDLYHGSSNVQHVVTLHSFQDRRACGCSAAAPEYSSSEYLRIPKTLVVQLRDTASFKASRTASTCLGPPSSHARTSSKDSRLIYAVLVRLHQDLTQYHITSEH